MEWRPDARALQAGLGEVGMTVMCSLAIGCNMRILLEMRNITVLSGSSVALSVFSFFVWAHILSVNVSTKNLRTYPSFNLRFIPQLCLCTHHPDTMSRNAFTSLHILYSPKSKL